MKKIIKIRLITKLQYDCRNNLHHIDQYSLLNLAHLLQQSQYRIRSI